MGVTMLLVVIASVGSLIAQDFIDAGPTHLKVFRRKLITTSIPIGQFGRKFPAVSLPSGASSTSSVAN